MLLLCFSWTDISTTAIPGHWSRPNDGTECVYVYDVSVLVF